MTSARSLLNKRRVRTSVESTSYLWVRYVWLGLSPRSPGRGIEDSATATHTQKIKVDPTLDKSPRNTKVDSVQFDSSAASAPHSFPLPTAARPGPRSSGER